jgi:hypothetical protein
MYKWNHNEEKTKKNDIQSDKRLFVLATTNDRLMKQTQCPYEKP